MTDRTRRAGASNEDARHAATYQSNQAHGSTTLELAALDRIGYVRHGLDAILTGLVDLDPTELDHLAIMLTRASAALVEARAARLGEAA